MIEKRFLKFADLPPNPMDTEDLENYKRLGMNICLLTEDDVKLVENGSLKEDYKEAVTRIGQTGMEVWIRNMFNDSDYFECASHKQGTNYGTPYEMEPRQITTEFREFSAVTGFYMADEAYMYTLPEQVPISWMKERANEFASFDKLVKLVEWKNKYYPEAFWHMNHVPGQSWDHYIPRNGQIYDYEDFLTEYAEVILKKLKGCGRSLCIDNYPLIGEDYIEKDYLYDLMVGAKVTRKYNEGVEETEKATFGICLQTFHAHAILDDRHRDIVSPEEITFQMYTGMALGARMFEYFCYHSYGDELLGILDPEGKKRIYEYVKIANERAMGLEKILCEFAQIGAFVAVGETCTENTAAFVMAKNFLQVDEDIQVHADYDTLIGTFVRDGQKGYMLVNYTDPIRKHQAHIKVSFRNAGKLRIYCEGQETEVALSDGTYTITLEAGGGAFLIP